jgi:hypothetical protein
MMQMTSTEGALISVLVVLFQTLIHGGTGASAWSLVVGFTDPVSGMWITIPTQYLSNDQVSVPANTSAVAIKSPAVVGIISVQPATIDIQLIYALGSVGGGFTLNAQFTSARGATYEQPGSNMSVEGGIVQNAYWSIVDAQIPPGKPCTFQPFGLLPTSPKYQCPTGWAWLDNEQIGMRPIPGIDRFLAALAPAKPVNMRGQKWLWTEIQSAAFQLDASVVGETGTSQLIEHAGTPKGIVRGSANIWITGRSLPIYDTPCTIQVLSLFKGTQVPSSITISIPALSTSSTATTITLTSRVPNAPQLEASGAVFYEAPCTTTLPAAPSGSPAPAGVIEWNTGTPSVETLAHIGGFSVDKAYALAGPSVATACVLTAIVLAFVAVLIIAAIFIDAAVKSRKAKRRTNILSPKMQGDSPSGAASASAGASVGGMLRKLLPRQGQIPTAPNLRYSGQGF